jgi:RimK family alpha-L-glutamate ligase
MQVVILSGPGWHTDELSRALTERGHVARVLPYEGLVAQLGSGLRSAGWLASQAEGLSCGQTAVFDADGVLARFIPTGSLEQIVFRIDALHWIEERGVPVMNPPRAIERSIDKFYTDALLREAGLPTPETVVCEGTGPAMAAVRTMLGGPGKDGLGRSRDEDGGTGRRSLDEGGAVVIKPIFGSMGHGIVRVSDPDVAFRVFQSLEQVRAVFYVQRAVDHGGRDVRVFVVGGKIVGAIERRAPDGDWRTNVSRGGTARPLELPAAWASLALRAAAAIGADYAGVDLLPAQDGDVFVLEVNGIPGWRGLQRVTGVDIAGEIVEHLMSRVQESRSAAELPA